MEFKEAYEIGKEADRDALKGILEGYIDKTKANEDPLALILEALADVCIDKAQHVEENWQDKRIARTWDDAADYLLRMLLKKKITEAGK